MPHHGDGHYQSIPNNNNQMKQSLSFTLILLYCVILSYAQTPNNVRIRLKLSPNIASVQQMIYLYGGMGANQCQIYDSIVTQPHVHEYLLQGYVPYEDAVELAFSRKGPMKLKILAHPGEDLELTIKDDEDRTGTMYKRLGESFWANDSLAVFWEKVFAYAKKKNILTDSMSIAGLSNQELASLRVKIDINEKQEYDYIRKTALTSPSPFVSHRALVVLWGGVSKDEYITISDSVKKRFPEYYPLHVKKWPEMTSQSKHNLHFIQSISTKRISVKNDLHKSDSLRIGDMLELSLIDGIGHSYQLSDYRGKFVLVEMWASWCRPCIEAMPNIIHAQKMYDGQFACCAISIDKSEISWKNAIRNYHLEELNHYKAVDNDGELFKDMRKLIVKGTIPQNYLLNKDGRIIAINIYGEKLMDKLKRLVKK